MFNSMFNKNPEVNDFTPSWLKLPANGSRPPLNWLQENSFQAARRNGSLTQKDDFNPSGQQRVISSVWTAPRPTAVPTAPAPARAPSNRMYKAVLPRNMTKRVLSRTAPPPSDANRDAQAEDNNNCSEAEERLLKEMGWDELRGEEPLTDEEITNFKHLNGGVSLLQQKQQLSDRANNNNSNGLQTNRGGLSSRRKLHGGPDLKKTLLATMGVSASCDDEDSEEDSDDNDGSD
ncbi:uncharacterized protein LOC100905204 [Galendromus occidentalis]|uniref:Uncharacterized protein LOC100905204 n=1 Tax=Galendromus occidentalis TaxID=34638 RepID=A0AAJ6QXM9_9ACAR|nr:uncharacterized protein LOC100905204 [Galendromus occidentalis]